MDPNKDKNPNRKAALASAKDGFRRRMLENDTFFAVVSKRSSSSAGLDRDLPDFACEPTYEVLPGGKTKWGVRFTASRATAADTPGLSVGLALYDYLDLATVDVDTGDTVLAPGFTEALSDTDTNPRSSEALSVIQDWQSGYNEIVRDFKGEAGIDPTTHTIALRAELDASFRVE